MLGKLESLATRVALRIPSVRKTFELADRHTQEISKLQKAFTETVSLIREQFSGYSSDGIRQMLLEQRDGFAATELVEAKLMAGAGPGVEPMDQAQIQKVVKDVAVKERLWELELALEDRGWKRQIAIAATEFSRYGLQQIILISRLYHIKNPLIRRGITICSMYVFGRGYEIACEDDSANEVIQKFLADNETELGHVGLVEKETSLHTDGNVFFAMFSKPKTGETQVRTIDACEIAEIIPNPDDASEHWYYRRSWAQQGFNYQTGVQSPEQKQAWYPALGFDPEELDLEKPKEIGGHPVMWETPVYHMRVGGFPKWLFGVPDVYVVLDWARAVVQFLSDFQTIKRAHARFAWAIETKGGNQAIAAFNQALATTLADGGTNIETNPPPTTGAAFVTGPGNKLTPVKTAGMTDGPEEVRRLVLMVAAGFGLPETFFGDASTGSLATAQSLDRPTELKFLERQQHWRSALQRICKYALERSNTAVAGKLREARKQVGKNGDLSDITITVKFPAVLEHDIKDMVEAIVNAATLGGYQLAEVFDVKTVAQLLLAELGYEDLAKYLEARWPESEYDVKAPDEEPEPVPVPGTPPRAAAQEARQARAVAELVRECRKLLKERAT